MKNRMLVFVVGVLSFCVTLLFSDKSLAQTPAEKLQILSQELNLSPQQKRELLPILEQEGPKLQEIKNNPSLTGGQKAMQLRAIHQQSDPQVKAILSLQQYQEWEAIRQREIQQVVEKKEAGPY